MFSTSPLDWGLILLYFGFLAAVWAGAFRRRPGALEYLVAGRRVTLPALVATLVATWYGGILGVGEYAWRYGIANWLVFGVPYYVGALLFALLFARRAREARLYTVPDLLERAYGRGPALMGALAVFVVAQPAAYVLMLGTLFAAMFGWPVAPCVVAAALLSIFYVDRGGLRTVVFTDQVQFALMYLGFALLLVFLVARHGTLPFLHAHLPASHFTWHGGNPPQAIFVWYFIALSALVDPGFWQRAYAARDPEVARRAVLWSIGWWALFDFMTTAAGLYARALLPRLADPVFAFPELARVTLPPFALGVFYLAMIATVMSTIDSYAFIAAATIGRDLVWRLARGDEERVPGWTRWGLWISGLFAAALALANPSVVALWHDLGSIVTPTLLLPVGTALLGRGRLGPRWTLAAMVAPFVVSLGWVLAHAFPPAGRAPAYPLSLEPIYAGLAASLIVYAAGRLSPRPEVAVKKSVLPIAVLAVLAFAPAARAAAAPDSAPDTLRRIVRLPEVVVSTTRLDERAPLARSVLGADEVARRNVGQDTPMLLASLPGAYAYSDAGNGIGYSYLSVRGFPQRRISVLVDGVPLNDPESNEVYWIDHPDLMASTREVQLQRGVGSALYGGASVGGTVAVELAPFGETPRSTATLAYGSWETKRLMLETDSGRLPGGWSYSGRYSRIETQGYRERSWSRLWSYAFAARRATASQSWRLTLFGGPEETHLAYLGVPRAYLDGAVTGDADRDRRFNPIAYANERDHFFEPHYELTHDWSPAKRWSVTQTLFWFDGRGYYDEQRFGRSLADYRLAPWWTADTTLAPAADYARDAAGNLVRDSLGRARIDRFDVVRRRTVANRHYGWLPRARWEHARGALTLGGELRAHDGRHWGEVLTGDPLPPGTPPGHAYYDYHPRTLSGSLYAREEWTPGPRLTVTADLGWRHQAYRMRGDHFDGIRFDQTYDFALPRLGLTFAPDPRTILFASWSASGREPAFRDLYDAEGAGSVPLYRVHDPATNTYADPLVRPERVNDWELGASWRGARAAAAANLFRMDFRDELVYAGQFNTDLGYPILGNAARSVHQGLELSARAEVPLERGLALSLDGNATLSDNHFVRYREVYGTSAADVVSYDGKALGLFPATLANVSARLSWRGAHALVAARYAGRMYLDNSESMAASIGPTTILDAGAGWAVPAGCSRLEVSFRIANLLDTRYAAGGYVDWDASGALVPMFVPAATRSVLTQVTAGF